MEHTTLQIIKGVFKAPRDANSAENEMDGIDLQDPNGLALQTDGWSPALPSLKSTTAWADSAIADGRTPLSGAVGNVTETLRLTMANVDLRQRMATFKKLGQLKGDIEAFWTTHWQIDPVFIRWHAALGAGDQYALIYNMEMAQDTDIFDLDTPWDITLTIEREPGWRGVWPGGNAREWSLEFKHQLVRGSPDYDLDNMEFADTLRPLAYRILANKHEWETAAKGDHVHAISQNYIEIPAEDIPGDLPALLSVHVSSVIQATGLYVAVSSKEMEKTSHQPKTRAQAYNFNGGDGSTTSSKVAGTSATGVISNNSNSVYYYVNMTLAASIGATASVIWGYDSSAAAQSIVIPDRELMRGVFIIFARGHVSTGGAGANDVKLRLTISEEDSLLSLLQTAQVLPDVSAPVDTVPRLTYLGSITIPFTDRSVVSMGGYGREIRGAATTFNLKLQVVNQIASARNYRLVDLIFLPIDEGSVFLPLAAADLNRILIDSTGYLTRGDPQLSARIRISAQQTDSAGVSNEVRGQALSLRPDKAQRVYILVDVPSNGGLALTCPVSVDIVPRWHGIRDV